MQARQHRAPPPAALWTLPTIGFGLFFIAIASSRRMPAELLTLSLFAAVCATPVVAAFVDSRAVVPVWLAGSMPVVAAVAIAASSSWWQHDETGGVSLLLIALFVAVYICFVVAVFMIRSVLRSHRRRP